ncbi:DoxX family membrane protein, partial [Staphylococcus arlettae]
MHIIIIILQIVVGIFFLMTGIKILSGTMSQEFERLGYPKIFNQITGTFEFVGGLALLIGIFFVPSALFGSILL